MGVTPSSPELAYSGRDILARKYQECATLSICGAATTLLRISFSPHRHSLHCRDRNGQEDVITKNGRVGSTPLCFEDCKTSWKESERNTGTASESVGLVGRQMSGFYYGCSLRRNDKKSWSVKVFCCGAKVKKRAECLLLPSLSNHLLFSSFHRKRGLVFRRPGILLSLWSECFHRWVGYLPCCRRHPLCF
jgi:hypothetical protein